MPIVRISLTKENFSHMSIYLMMCNLLFSVIFTYYTAICAYYRFYKDNILLFIYKL